MRPRPGRCWRGRSRRRWAVFTSILPSISTAPDIHPHNRDPLPSERNKLFDVPVASALKWRILSSTIGGGNCLSMAKTQVTLALVGLLSGWGRVEVQGSNSPSLTEVAPNAAPSSPPQAEAEGSTV